MPSALHLVSRAVGFSLPGNSGDFMSTTPHPPSTEAASNIAERVTLGSRRSPNSLKAARVVRQTRRSAPAGHREPRTGDHPEQLALTFETPKEPPPRPPRTEKPTAGTAIQRFVALHVNLDKTAARSRETCSAQAAWINRCWLVILRCARAAAIRLARSFRTSSGCPRCHVAGVM